MSTCAIVQNKCHSHWQCLADWLSLPIQMLVSSTSLSPKKYMPTSHKGTPLCSIVHTEHTKLRDTEILPREKVKSRCKWHVRVRAEKKRNVIFCTREHKIDAWKQPQQREKNDGQQSIAQIAINIHFIAIRRRIPANFTRKNLCTHTCAYFACRIHQFQFSSISDFPWHNFVFVRCSCSHICRTYVIYFIVLSYLLLFSTTAMTL